MNILEYLHISIHHSQNIYKTKLFISSKIYTYIRKKQEYLLFRSNLSVEVLVGVLSGKISGKACLVDGVSVQERKREIDLKNKKNQ